MQGLLAIPHSPDVSMRAYVGPRVKGGGEERREGYGVMHHVDCRERCGCMLRNAIEEIVNVKQF